MTRPRAPKPPSRQQKPPNALLAQRPLHPGETETIAARRVKALELRKSGASYRLIGQALGVDVATAWDDVQAELTALRMLTVKVAEDVRTLELERLDRWLAKLEAHGIAAGDPQAINTAIRLSESRRKLLGVDAPLKVQDVPHDRDVPHDKLDQRIDELQREIAAADTRRGPAGAPPAVHWRHDAPTPQPDP